MIVNQPQIDCNTQILPGAIIVGYVILARGCSVWYNAVLRGDVAAIQIGENTNIQDGCILHVDFDHPLIVGKGVTVGHGAILHSCEIGDNTLIGMGAILLNGAKIGKNCIIGAGALVTQNTVVPDGSVALGSPARVIRPVTEQEIASNRRNAEAYLQLKHEYHND